MTKQTAKDKLYAYVAKQGWTPDPTATINTYRRGWSSPDFDDLPADEQAKYIKQNPNVFTKPATDGGRWQVTLDYEGRTYRGAKNRLWGAELRYFNHVGAQQSLPLVTERSFRDDYIAPVRLKSRAVGYTHRHSSTAVFDVTGGDDYDTPIGKRVEKLLADPELVIWLAAEYQHEINVASEKARIAAEEDRALRDRPLPEGFYLLKRLTREIDRADGKTDVVDLLSRLREAIATVEGNLISPVN